MVVVGVLEIEVVGLLFVEGVVLGVFGGYYIYDYNYEENLFFYSNYGVYKVRIGRRWSRYYCLNYK